MTCWLADQRSNIWAAAFNDVPVEFMLGLNSDRDLWDQLAHWNGYDAYFNQQHFQVVGKTRLQDRECWIVRRHELRMQHGEPCHFHYYYIDLNRDSVLLRYESYTIKPEMNRPIPKEDLAVEHPDQAPVNLKYYPLAIPPGAGPGIDTEINWQKDKQTGLLVPAEWTSVWYDKTAENPSIPDTRCRHKLTHLSVNPTFDDGTFKLKLMPGTITQYNLGKDPVTGENRTMRTRFDENGLEIPLLD